MKQSEDNPRIQCHDCGKWMRLFVAEDRMAIENEVQRFYGGDSFCGRICTKCIKKHSEEGTFELEATNCKRNCRKLELLT